MYVRKVSIIITLLLGLILVIVYLLTKNPYVGLVGYFLQLLGTLMFIGDAVSKIRKKKKRQTPKDSHPF